MTDSTPTGTPSSNRGVMIVLSYLWLLALVPLLIEKGDSEVQWHAKHGLVLMVAEVILGIGLNIVTFILFRIAGPIGCMAALVVPVIWVGVLVIHVMAIMKGVNGSRLIIPGVSEYADRF